VASAREPAEQNQHDKSPRNAASQQKGERRGRRPEQRLDDEYRIAVEPAIVERPPRMHAVRVERVHADVQQRRQHGERGEPDVVPAFEGRSPPAQPYRGGDEQDRTFEQRADDRVRVPSMLEQIAELVVGAQRVQQIAVRDIAPDHHDRQKQAATHGRVAVALRGWRMSRRGFAEQRAYERVSYVVQGQAFARIEVRGNAFLP